jgi:tetratricopeptide (TPR) repeat protein
LSPQSPDPAYLNFVEHLLADSVVLLLRDGTRCGTGFFVSPQGDVCSCHHLGLDFQKPRFEALWRGKSYRLEYNSAASTGVEDFSIWTIAGDAAERADFPSVPVLADPLPDHNSPALALGYGGLEDRDAPVAIRTFPGIVDRPREYSVGPETVERLEILDMAVGKGASGAPVFDLRMFRVVGYVQGGFGTASARIQRLGRACSLSYLVRLRPDLIPIWQRVGAEFDSRKRSFFKTVLFPNRYLSLPDAQHAARQASLSELDRLKRERIYDLYSSRALSGIVNGFIHDNTKGILLLTGFSATGKTNLLINTYIEQHTSFDLAAFLQFRGLEDRPLGEAISRRLAVEGPLPALQQLLRGSGYRSTLLILDGFEDCPRPTNSHLKALLDECVAIRASDPSHRTKIIISIRREWIADAASSLLEYSDTPASDSVDLETVFFDVVERPNGTTGYRPVVELTTLRPSDSRQGDEQRQIYARYRETLAPPHTIAEYDDLPLSVRRILDRPLIIKLFVNHYADRHIPDAPVRAVFIAEIVKSDAGRLPGGPTVRRAAGILLEGLAFERFQAGLSALPDRVLLSKQWYDRSLLDLLLINTFYLSRNEIRGPVIDSQEIAFRSDWIADYYLGLHLFEEAGQLGTVLARRRFIDKMFALVRHGADSSSLITALSYLCDFCTRDQHDTFVALWMALSRPTRDTGLSDIVRHICEYMRQTYGFAANAVGDAHQGSVFLQKLRSTPNIGGEGWRRIVRYAEGLGDHGTPDSVALLDVYPPAFAAFDKELQDEWNSVLALKLFMKHAVDDALQLLHTLDFASLPPQIQSRVSFVEGRCLQFRQRYAEAKASFERAVEIDGEYGSMCRHQLGFILFLRDSNYNAAASILASNPDNHASRLLFIQCLIETGNYDRAAGLLASELAWRTQRRRTLTFGKVKRVEAQLLTRLFRIEAATAACDEAIECSMDSVHFLSYAHVLETKGTILGVFVGDVTTALRLLDQSIELAKRADHHPTLSWSLQTRVLLEVVAGGTADIEGKLAAAAQLHTNPNQQRRTRLIGLLAHLRRQHGRSAGLIHQCTLLRAEYENSGQKWYAGLLILIEAKLRGELPRAMDAIPDLFSAKVDKSGLKHSYLIHQLLSS